MIHILSRYFYIYIDIYKEPFYPIATLILAYSSTAVHHSWCITNSVCDVYQCDDVCMRQMFQEAEATEAMNGWITGLLKRSYRYRILSPVICLLSLPLSQQTKIHLISCCRVPREMRSLSRSSAHSIPLCCFWVCSCSSALAAVVCVLSLCCCPACMTGYLEVFLIRSIVISTQADANAIRLGPTLRGYPIYTHTRHVLSKE